ncbi:response regulator [Thiospirochaeta perfilievii]|uniref:Response regulator n=1 Tax=Thiospirochaeta perfilievii TaxID=252967 RepID=A0A5C1Q8F2_9SPIO|nr:response regulator [Thiospirochaeta perfilievii]QEN03166.1 response regulator [Thiospirochaeta perfilievii]
MKILVVDDSRIMRNIVKNSLLSDKKANHEFVEADNGVDAFNIIEKENIDILLVDWNMPHLNGLDLVKELRSLPKHAKLPIIMITSEAAKYNVIEAVKAGVNDYMIKPIKDDKLLEKIDQVLESVK